MHIKGKLKAVDNDLLVRAKDKAKLEGNDYVAVLLGCMNPDKLSPSDRDTLNDYLGFGDGIMATVIKGKVTFEVGG